MTRIKVLIADDHSVVRIGLNALLATESDIEVVGEADDGSAAVRMAAELKPNVVLMDLMMPDLDGAAATRELKKLSPNVKVLILTTFSSPEHINAALTAGASGAMLKSATDEEILDAVRKVAAGETIISQEIGQLLSVTSQTPNFTTRQLEVLTYITEGHTNREIARRLGIREDSVGEHITAIFSKLGVSNRAKAVAIALRKHLLKI